MVNNGWIVILVGGFNHCWKILVNGKDDNPYMTWKKNMFETTNQIKQKEFESLYG